MIITISNKTLTEKPQTDLAKGRYFKGIKFNTIETNLDSLKEIIDNGYTIGYLTVDGNNLRRKNNYKGTQFICIDIDCTTLTIDEIRNKAVHTPTIAHTTFSNCTPNKNNLYCYHLLYVLDRVVEGEDNFKHLFTYFSQGLEPYIDGAAKDNNRIIFTTNSNLPNYQYINTETIYNADSVLLEEVDITTLYKPQYTTTKTTKQDITYMPQTISTEFKEDYNTLSRWEFITKYSSTYPYYTETQIDTTLGVNGYVDLRGTNYYKVQSAQYIYKDGERIIRKVESGNRTKALFTDALAFCHIIPQITLEHLIYCLTVTTYNYYNNEDGEITNYKIAATAKAVLNNLDTYQAKTVNKKFKINKEYWYNQGLTPIQAVGKINKTLKDEQIGSVIDLDISIEENLKTFKDLGINCDKRRLQAFLTDNGLTLHSSKEKRNKAILEAYKANPTLSSRKLKDLLNKDGIKVSHITVEKVIAEVK